MSVFSTWLENTVDIPTLNSAAPLINQWFVGGFMHGKRQEDMESLLKAFEMLKTLSPVTTSMTLFRVQPLERSIHNIVETNLYLVSSWCESDVFARRFYHAVSTDKNSSIRFKSHAIIKSRFEPREILISVSQLLPKLDELLESLNDNDNFPYRLANLYHSMKWHKDQHEVIVNAPGLREVKVVQWL